MQAFAVKSRSQRELGPGGVSWLTLEAVSSVVVKRLNDLVQRRDHGDQATSPTRTASPAT